MDPSRVSVDQVTGEWRYRIGGPGDVVVISPTRDALEEDVQRILEMIATQEETVQRDVT